VDERKPDFVADRVEAPDFVDPNLFVFTKAARHIDHAGRNVQVKGGTKPAEVGPLGQRFQVIDRFTRLDLDNDLKAVATLQRSEDDIGVDGRRTCADRRRLLRSDIGADFIAAAKFGLKKSDDPVVLELFADRPHQYRAHSTPPAVELAQEPKWCRHR
jgi:hypothetical protein